MFPFRDMTGGIPGGRAGPGGFHFPNHMFNKEGGLPVPGSHSQFNMPPLPIPGSYSQPSTTMPMDASYPSNMNTNNMIPGMFTALNDLILRGVQEQATPGNTFRNPNPIFSCNRETEQAQKKEAEVLDVYNDFFSESVCISVKSLLEGHARLKPTLEYMFPTFKTDMQNTETLVQEYVTLYDAREYIDPKKCSIQYIKKWRELLGKWAEKLDATNNNKKRITDARQILSSMIAIFESEMTAKNIDSIRKSVTFLSEQLVILTFAVMNDFPTRAPLSDMYKRFVESNMPHAGVEGTIKININNECNPREDDQKNELRDTFLGAISPSFTEAEIKALLGDIWEYKD